MAATRKIAILGGGVGSIVSAFALTDVDNWQDRYEITLYQMGWRIGGKGASGRNPKHADRIEEHGLHIWLGFYENAFQAMQRAYEELGRSPTAPLARWDQAFKKHSYITIQENIQGSWETWNIDFPVNSAVPGDGTPLPSIGDYFYMMVQMALAQITGLPISSLHEKINQPDPTNQDESLVKMIVDAAAGGLVDTLKHLPQTILVRSVDYLASQARHAHGIASAHKILLPVLDVLLRNFWSELESQIETDTEKRRAFILASLAYTIAKGMVADGLLIHGFDVINDENFTDWLRRHGAPEITVQSAVVRAWYDLVFGFPGGDTSKEGQFEAGTSLRAIMRLAFTYKGAVFWEMQAGMGDTVFTPFYEVLKRRGVKFEFFHKIKNLALNSQQDEIESIEIGIQATPKPGIEYNPLIDVKGLACWPSVPNYDQLEQGAALEAGGYNLESSWTDWQDVAQKTLRKGTDFDDVICGVAVGALPDMTQELMQASSKWNDMVTNLTTVQTLALQLWLRPDVEGLGWPYPKTVMTAYADQFNTWSDMSHLIPRESWPPEHSPFHIAYFCGPMLEEQTIPPFSDHGYPAREHEKIYDKAIHWLNTNPIHLWPNANRDDNPVGLNWNLLIDPSNAVGEDRMRSQFWRANIDPTERYVLSTPGTTKYRMKPGEAPFKNLYLAGDWTINGINAGCVEAATISGLMCSRAISGYPEKIYGEYDLD